MRGKREAQGEKKKGAPLLPFLFSGQEVEEEKKKEHVDCLLFFSLSPCPFSRYRFFLPLLNLPMKSSASKAQSVLLRSRRAEGPLVERGEEARAQERERERGADRCLLSSSSKRRVYFFFSKALDHFFEGDDRKKKKNSTRRNGRRQAPRPAQGPSPLLLQLLLCDVISALALERARARAKRAKREEGH